MMIVIQDKRRQRRKHLGRLRRHLAPPELHLWEKEEEEEDRGSRHGMAVLRQLSLGTSLSTSTLTDCGFPPVCSDGDTADNTSEAISPERHSRAVTRYSTWKSSTTITLTCYVLFLWLTLYLVLFSAGAAKKKKQKNMRRRLLLGLRASSRRRVTQAMPRRMNSPPYL